MTSIRTEDDQPMTRAVLPDGEDWSGPITNLIRVGEGFVGGIGGQSMSGDVVAPMALVDTFTHEESALQRQYGNRSKHPGLYWPHVGHRRIRWWAHKLLTGTNGYSTELWNNGTTSRCEFLDEGVLLMPGALRSPLRLGGAVAGAGALVAMALPTWPAQSRWGPDQPLVETWQSWFDINIAFWSANYAVILAATACAMGCLSLGLGWRSGARLRTAAGFFIASGVLGVVGAVFFPEPIGINLVGIILASVAGVLLALERHREISSLPLRHPGAV